MILEIAIKSLKFLRENILNNILRFGFKLFYRKDDRIARLPKSKNDYLLMPANKLALLIRSRSVKSQEIVQLYIDRIKDIQPNLNCVVATCFESAIQEAINVDKILDSEQIPEKYSAKNAPLLGVPFSCKESLWVKNMPNSTGIKARKDFRAPEDSDVVKYMREAGAILTCTTNTSEGCMWFESINYLYGTTKNPYNLSRTVGGSSGGEGCLISAAGSVIGIGSDIGGSIRMPAFFNGIYGHKPTYKFISNKVQHPPTSGLGEEMLVTGPLCRYASDLKIMFKIFSGPRYNEVEANFEANVDFKNIRFYVFKPQDDNLLVSNLSIDSKNAMDRAVAFIKNSFGVEVNEIKLKKLDKIFQVWDTMLKEGHKKTDEFVYVLGDSKKTVNPFLELLKSIFGIQYNHTLPALLYSIMEKIPEIGAKDNIELGVKLRQELSDLLKNDAILIFPSFPVTSFYHNQATFSHTFDFIYFAIFNVLGFPSTQCPMGLNKDGLPTGIQIVSNHMMDHLTIKLAEYFETNLIGWVPPF